MSPQPTQPDAPCVDTNATAAAERAADETLDRIAIARQDADTPDDQCAELGWREVLALAEQLRHDAQAVLDALLEATAPGNTQAPR